MRQRSLRKGNPNHALEPTAASALRLLAVPSSLRSSAAAQRERWAHWTISVPSFSLCSSARARVRLTNAAVLPSPAPCAVPSHTTGRGHTVCNASRIGVHRALVAARTEVGSVSPSLCVLKSVGFTPGARASPRVAAPSSLGTWPMLRLSKPNPRAASSAKAVVQAPLCGHRRGGA
jgi:hypothetical protein